MTGSHNCIDRDCDDPCHDKEQHLPVEGHRTSNGVRYFRLGEGYNLRGMQQELRDYRDILLGRVDPPIDRGIMTLMECAEAFHARAKEMEQELLDLEAENAILKGSKPYKFRTGMLRSFIEATAKTIDLGSRRVTYEKDLANGRG